MSFVALTCPTCGGPLPKEALKRTVTCQYCGASVMHDVWTVRRRDFTVARDVEQHAARTAAGAQLVEVGARAYALLQKVASGDTSDVWLADRADGVRERVTLYVLRDPSGLPRLQRSRDALQSLHEKAIVARRIPHLRQSGTLSGALGPHEALVVGFESGFVQSLWDVRQYLGANLDQGHAVWIWRRVLDVLMRVHEVGRCHRALVPTHLLVHARDHGVLVVGWGESTEGAAQLGGLIEPFAALYPEAVVNGRPFSAADDVVMSARVTGWLLGNGDGWEPPNTTPAPLRDWILTVGSGQGNPKQLSARAVDAELLRRAEAAFGKPKYLSLRMPGWK